MRCRARTPRPSAPPIRRWRKGRPRWPSAGGCRVQRRTGPSGEGRLPELVKKTPDMAITPTTSPGAPFGAGHLMIMSTSFLSAYVLPALADAVPGYVNGVLAEATKRRRHDRARLLALAHRAHRHHDSADRCRRRARWWHSGLAITIAIALSGLVVCAVLWAPPSRIVPPRALWLARRRRQIVALRAFLNLHVYCPASSPGQHLRGTAGAVSLTLLGGTKT